MTWQYVAGPNVGSQSGGGESDRPVRWRPGDLVPKRLRYGGEYSVWKAAVNPFAPSGRVRPNMLFILPKFPMLNSQNSAYYARIMPNHAQLCRLIYRGHAGMFGLTLPSGGGRAAAARPDPLPVGPLQT